MIVQYNNNHKIVTVFTINMHHYSIVTKLNLQDVTYVYDLVYSAKALVIPAAQNPFFASEVLFCKY